AEFEDGAVVADVPCGAGLALRGLAPGQDVRLIGVDLDPTMLDRMRAKAAARALDQVELLEGEMRELPLPDASADHLISFSGLHMINDPERAVAEFARVLKPGGTIVGTSFVWAGARRKRFLWKLEERRGIAVPPADAAAVESMLAEAGFDRITVTGNGFVNFRAQLPPFHS
ncbi:MAG: class I SAM-dependent methyltransferase, partial [Solirubrobacterales bacterium]